MGATGPGGSVTTVIPYGTGQWALWNAQYLANFLSDPTGVNRLEVGQATAWSPVTSSQNDIDATRNSFAWVAPRAGTLSQMPVRLMILLQDAALDNNVVLTITILLGPAVPSANDFVASPITTTITIPSGTAPDVETFFEAADTTHSAAVVAGQRVVMEVVATYDPTGNQDEVFSLFAFSAGLQFA